MGLREELQGIDPSKMIDVFSDTTPRQFHLPDSGETELVLIRDYRPLYATTTAARSYAEEVIGLSPREAALIAGGMVLAYALLKDYAERQTVEPIELEPPQF